MDSVKKDSFTAIKKGSKSFSLAGLLLPKESREDAFLLYHWCRHCDDAVDKASSKEEALKRLEEIKAGTVQAMKGNAHSGSPYIALSRVFAKHHIPEHYPLELLEGMKMDVEGKSYSDLKDLELYCYRVAGVVGLMMSHIIGVSDERALRHARDLGIAMQLTNICRDVYTDARMGRVYLPQDQLDFYHVDRKEILREQNKSAFAKICRELLDTADHFYSSGEKGLRYLNFQTAFSIQSASYIYSEIGKLIVYKRERAWDERVYTTTLRKLVLITKAFFKVTTSLWIRRSTWSPVPIKTIIKHS